MEPPELSRLHLKAIVDNANQGIVLVDDRFRVVYFNRFMELHSGRPAAEIVGRDVFECFEELPRAWLSKKLKSVFLLDNFSFTNWLDRPYLFRLQHNRPITGGVDFMRQDCTFFPVRDAAGTPANVCIAISDATDTALYHAQLQQALSRVEALSVSDGLTGLANRRRLDEVLQSELTRTQRYGGELSVVLFDIDHFKVVNDTHGHLAGDEVLRRVADRAASSVRSSDLCARFGGEEFAVVAPATSEEGAAVLGERLRAAIAASPVHHEGAAISVTISVGVASCREGVDPLEAILGRCDRALYAAKAAGRDRVVRFGSVPQHPHPREIGGSQE